MGAGLRASTELSPPGSAIGPQPEFVDKRRQNHGRGQTPICGCVER